MIKNIIKVLSANLIVTVLGLISSFVFPKLMDIEQYAYYHTFLLYISYIGIFHLGIPTGMFIIYGGKEYKSIDKSSYKSEILLILFILIFFTICAGSIAHIIKNEIIFFVAIAIIPNCIIVTYKVLYQAWGNFTRYAFLNVVTTSLVTVLAFIFYFVFNHLNGLTLIFSYLLINSSTCYVLLTYFLKDVRKVKTAPLLSRRNYETAKVGCFVMFGNYINVLFHATDKQFVRILFSDHSFAMYSFAMSTQNIMTIFITALAQPFYPKLAKANMNKTEYNTLKELLLMFGAFSGCAYFAVDYLIKNFIPKYMGSIVVIKMFFAVFPAMAVINVLYINLYKVTKQTKRYILSLSIVLILAICLNIAAVYAKGDYVGISFATLVVYYFWLFYSSRHFNSIKIGKRDVLYLAGFASIYFVSVNFLANYVGFLAFGVGIIIWDLLVFRKSLIYLVTQSISIICRPKLL